MELTKELFEKAKQTKSADELIAFAKENNITLTADEAAEYFAQLHKCGEIDDDELDNVTGGCLFKENTYVPKDTPGNYVAYKESNPDHHLFNLGDRVKVLEHGSVQGAISEIQGYRSFPDGNCWAYTVSGDDGNVYSYIEEWFLEKA